jgi:hypothetical protein
MADNDSKRLRLSDQQKNEVRAAMNAYKKEHPKAPLKEVQANLNLPYRDQITEGMLRGLSARNKSGSGAGRPKSVRGRGRTSKNRSLELVIGELNELRKQRDALDSQIDDLESELRDRMREQLGPDQAGRIFGNLLSHASDMAGRVTSTVSDTAGRVSATVSDTISGAVQRVRGEE